MQQCHFNRIMKIKWNDFCESWSPKKSTYGKHRSSACNHATALDLSCKNGRWLNPKKAPQWREKFWSKVIVVTHHLKEIGIDIPKWSTELVQQFTQREDSNWEYKSGCSPADTIPAALHVLPVERHSTLELQHQEIMAPLSAVLLLM